MRIKQKIYHFLRQSEKYTKTDMVYLAKGGSWLTLGQIVSNISALALLIAFANLLPRETYGAYKYVLSLFGILTIFSLPGINTAVVQAVARGYEGSFTQAFKTKLKWGALGSLAALGMAAYYWLNSNTDLPIPLLLIAIFLPLMQASQIYSSLLAGRKLFSWQTKFLTAGRIVSLISMFFVLFLTNNLIWIIVTYLLNNTLTNTFLYFLTKTKFKPNKKRDPQIISYGKHLSVINVVGIIASYLDRLLIFHYLGAVELAIYSFALAPINQIKSTFKNIPTLAMPKLAQRSFKEIDAVLFKRLFKLFLLGSAIALFYVLLAPYFYKIFFPKYLDSIFFSQLLAITIALRLPISLLGAAGQSKLNLVPKSWLYWSTIPQIILIVSLLLLVQAYGIIGVIISKIIFLIAILTISLTRWKLVLKKYFKKLENNEEKK
jgi:O-antigen/teichoic acid export membrane protein